MPYLPILPYLRYSRLFPAWLVQLRRALLPLEDQWTWTTRDGAVFEEVEVEGIEADHVIFQHKFGKAHIPIVFLSEDSRLNLDRGLRGWTDHPASHGTQAKTFEATIFATPAGKQEKPPNSLSSGPYNSAPANLIPF